MPPIETSSQAKPFTPDDLLLVRPEPAPGTPTLVENAAAKPQPVEQAEAPTTDPEPEIEITEADRDAFMRHMLGADRFIKDYSTAEGKIRVTLQTRTVLENDEVYDALSSMVRAGRMTTNPASLEYVLYMYRLYLAGSVVGITIGDTQLRPPAATQGSVTKRHDWLRSTLSETQFRLLLRFQEDFEALVAALYREGLASDFMFGRAHVS